jgi:hypothetical protein
MKEQFHSILPLDKYAYFGYHISMEKNMEQKLLLENLRQQAKFVNLSNPFLHRLLLDAADRIEELERSEDAFYQALVQEKRFPQEN